MKTFRQRLTRGFALVRRRGYVAKQNWQCCLGCGLAALPEGTTKYVFYHAQDAKRMDQTSSVYLAWGGYGYEIRQCFLEAGLAVTWEGREDQRVLVSLPPSHPVSSTEDSGYAECIDALLNC